MNQSKLYFSERVQKSDILRRHSNPRSVTSMARWLRMRHRQRAMAQVRMMLRLAAGGTCFLLMLGVIGGIECGQIGLLPGCIWCALLLATTVLCFRGIQVQP